MGRVIGKSVAHKVTCRMGRVMVRQRGLLYRMGRVTDQSVEHKGQL